MTLTEFIDRQQHTPLLPCRLSGRTAAVFGFLAVLAGTQVVMPTVYGGDVCEELDWLDYELNTGYNSLPTYLFPSDISGAN